MSRKIQVFILVTEGLSHSNKLRNCFSDSLFVVEFVKQSDKCIDERIIDCLKRCNTENCIILTDKLICLHGSRSVKKIIENCLSVPDFDIAYLFKYKDKCQMHTPIKTSSPISIVRSHSPNGVEAILYSKNAIDIILGRKTMSSGKKFKKNYIDKSLNKAIYEGEITAIATTPNLFEFDIEHHSSSTEYYKYRNECAPLQDFPEEITDNSRSIMTILFILIIVIIATWALLKI